MLSSDMLSPLQTKTLMGEVMKVAAFSLAEVKFAIGGETSLPQVVLQNVNKAQIKVRTKKDNVAGQWWMRGGGGRVALGSCGGWGR